MAFFWSVIAVKDELPYAETLGFAGVVVNEHQASAYGNMPAPNLIASILARQTNVKAWQIQSSVTTLYRQK